MVPKVSYMYKAYMTGKLNEVIKDKTSGVGKNNSILFILYEIKF